MTQHAAAKRRSLRIRRGLAVAKQRGVTLGRPSRVTPAQLKQVRRLHTQGKSSGDIAARLNLSKSTVWRMVRRPWRGKG